MVPGRTRKYSPKAPGRQWPGPPSRVIQSLRVRAARATSFVLLSLAAACGGNGTPGGPSSPTPPPGTPVSGFVFYDENANGIADPNETMRLPGVTVAIGSASAQTTAGGRVTVSSVLPGAQAASLRPDTLPVRSERDHAAAGGDGRHRERLRPDDRRGPGHREQRAAGRPGREPPPRHPARPIRTRPCGCRG